MDNDDLINGIRDRMERCRRLAAQMTDDHARTELLKLAEEGEAEIRRLEEEARGGQQAIQAQIPGQRV
jgi:hypothetical protein